MITGERIGRVTDRNKDISSIAVIGKIKCGEKVVGQNGKEYARSLDYFKATGSYASHFNEAYATQPNLIQIIFISDDVSFSCPERYELRDKKGKLFGRGDGKRYEIWSRDKGAYVPVSLTDMPDLKEVSASKAESAKGWERVLTLRFLIPKIRGIMGVWEFSTKAEKASIDSIVDTFDLVQRQAGTVQRILFDLTVEKVTSQKPDDPSSYPKIRLIPNMSDDNMMKLSSYIQNGGILSGIPIITDNLIEEHLEIKNANLLTAGEEETETDEQ